MSAKAKSDKKIKITQVRSAIGTPADQKATIRALGLKRMHDTVEQVDSPSVRGMIFKVKHLVSVDEG